MTYQLSGVGTNSEKRLQHRLEDAEQAYPNSEKEECYCDFQYPLCGEKDELTSTSLDNTLSVRLDTSRLPANTELLVSVAPGSLLVIDASNRKILKLVNLPIRVDPKATAACWEGGNLLLELRGQP